MPYPCQAIVASAPALCGQPKFSLDDLFLRELGDNECLVEIIASGICHTDIAVATSPEGVYPRVLGHEGAGYIRKIGAKVRTNADPSEPALYEGAPVLLSYVSCGNCSSCQSGHPAYCLSCLDLCFRDTSPAYTRRVGTSTVSEPCVAGGFFGQSSLGNLAIVKERCIINMTGVTESRDELQLFAPLGCGFQTGAATISILANARPSDSVTIIGLGGVGLASIMAAKIIGCKVIIAVDRVEDKLKIAEELGATVTINSESYGPDLPQAVRQVTNGAGSTITVDTTGFLPIIQQGLDMTSVLGKMILLGMTRESLEVNISQFKISGKTLIGSVQGDAIASIYIPQMIKWYREGRFPIAKLTKFYKARDIQKALQDLKDGKVVKPVLLWD